MSKSIPYGLLAIAVSSSLLVAQGDKPAAGGWSAKPGSGLSYDGGDAFGLKLVNRLQVHWTFAANEDAPDTNSFDIRRARTSLSGHVFNRNILYMLQLEWNDAASSIKQAWTQWNFSHSEDSTIGLRAGQAKTMFGLEATWTSAGLWFVERSIASRTFADSYSRGAWLNGGLMSKSSTPLRFVVGAMNTDTAKEMSGILDTGEETANPDNELSYVLAANIDPCGDFHDGKQTIESNRQGDWRTDNHDLKGTIGLGLALGNGVDSGGAGAGADVESTSFNINTAWNVAKANILAEYFMRTDDLQGAASDEEESSGFSVSVGYLLDKSGDSAIQWGLGIRYSMVETDAGDAGGVNYIDLIGGGTEGDLSELSLVVNAFYHGHSCKTQIEYTMQSVEPTGGNDVTNNILRIGFQLEF